MQNKVSSVYVPAVEMQVSLNAHTPARVRAAMLAKRVSGAAGSRSATCREGRAGRVVPVALYGGGGTLAVMTPPTDISPALLYAPKQGV